MPFGLFDYLYARDAANPAFGAMTAGDVDYNYSGDPERARRKYGTGPLKKPSVWQGLFAPESAKNQLAVNQQYQLAPALAQQQRMLADLDAQQQEATRRSIWMMNAKSNPNFAGQDLDTLYPQYRAHEEFNPVHARTVNEASADIARGVPEAEANRRLAQAKFSEAEDTANLPLIAPKNDYLKSGWRAGQAENTRRAIGLETQLTNEPAIRDIARYNQNNELFGERYNVRPSELGTAPSLFTYKEGEGMTGMPNPFRVNPLEQTMRDAESLAGGTALDQLGRSAGLTKKAAVIPVQGGDLGGRVQRTVPTVTNRAPAVTFGKSFGDLATPTPFEQNMPTKDEALEFLGVKRDAKGEIQLVPKYEEKTIIGPAGGSIMRVPVERSPAEVQNIMRRAVNILRDPRIPEKKLKAQ